MRLTAGATSDSRPNSSSTIGVVAACAANETPRISATQRRSRPGAAPARRSVIDEPHAMIPAVASTDRRKPASSIQAGIDEQQAGDRPAERRRGRARPAQLASEERDARHHAGADDRRRRPDERDVDHDRDGGQDRPAAALEAAGDGRERRRDDGDVPAGDGHDVARPGGRERGGEVAIDPVAKPDQDARREPGLGLGDRAVEAFGGGTAKALELAGERARGGEDLERVRTERPDGADPGQVRAVVVLGWRPDPARQPDPIAGHDRRVPRQRRGDDDRRAARRARRSRVARPPAARRPTGPSRPTARRRRAAAPAAGAAPPVAPRSPIATTPIATGARRRHHRRPAGEPKARRREQQRRPREQRHDAARHPGARAPPRRRRRRATRRAARSADRDERPDVLERLTRRRGRARAAPRSPRTARSRATP